MTITEKTRGMRKDADSIAIQAGNQILTKDDAGILSPVAYDSDTDFLTIPKGAVEVVMKPTTDLKVSEESDLSSYYPITANIGEPIPCADVDKIYYSRVSADGDLGFRFIFI